MDFNFTSRNRQYKLLWILNIGLKNIQIIFSWNASSIRHWPIYKKIMPWRIQEFQECNCVLKHLVSFIDMYNRDRWITAKYDLFLTHDWLKYCKSN